MFKKILKDLWQQGQGKAGLILLGFLILASLPVPLVFPQDFGKEVWNSPSYWADNPKTVPPAWIRIFDSEKTTHQVFRKEIPEVVKDDAGKVYLYQFEVKRSAEDLPAFASFSVSDILFYGDPPIIEVYFREKDKEILLYRQLIPPSRQGESPPFSRYSEEPLRVQLTSDSEIRGKIEGFFAGLSSEGDEQFLAEVRIHLAHFEDEVEEVKLVFGGEVFGLLGTDNLGRDLFQGLWFGLPIILFLALTVSLLGNLIGSVLGAVSGYFAGKIDTLIQRSTDVVVSLPVLPLLIFLIFTLGAHFYLLIVFLVAFGWTGLTIKLRPWILQLREMGFIDYAKARGLSSQRIISWHILPQTLPFLFANFVVSVPIVILTEAGLSFLGLGDPSLPTWGQILHQAYNTGAVYLGYLWWVIPPGIAIIFTGLAFRLIGEALRTIADPRLGRE